MPAEFLKKRRKEWCLLNRVEIYKDNEIKVEIDGAFHNYLESVFIKSVKLEQYQYNLLLHIILTELRNNGLKYEQCSIAMNSAAPIVERYKSIRLIDRFQTLQIAFDYLSVLEERNNKMEIISTLDNLYVEQDVPFHMNFFEKPIFGIDGYMAIKEDNAILITLFVYPD